MINAITPPMTTIPSVEPILDSSCCNGVVVDWTKKAPDERFPCAMSGLGKVSAALTAARTRLRKMAITERTSRLMASLVYHVRILPNLILYMYLAVLLQYNARDAGGVRQHAFFEEREHCFSVDWYSFFTYSSHHFFDRDESCVCVGCFFFNRIKSIQLTDRDVYYCIA